MDGGLIILPILARGIDDFESFLPFGTLQNKDTWSFNFKIKTNESLEFN